MCLLLSLSLLVICTASSVVQTWTWGEGIPRILSPTNEDMDIPEDYPDHGFIQIQTSVDNVLSINLVKRPPPTYWPRSGSFCSQMLPAAIEDYMDRNEIRSVTAIHVAIDADPYEAGSKCYLKTMLEMGLGRVNGKLVSSASGVEEFCSLREFEVMGRPTSPGTLGRIPTGVTEEHRQLLKISSTHRFIQRFNTNSNMVSIELF